MSYKAEIPYGAYWSTPFARWQGSLSHLNAVEFAAHVAKAELAKRKEQEDTALAGLGAHLNRDRSKEA